MRMRRIAVLLGVCILLLLQASRCDGCFSIVVGKKASADGFVIMAHNEDDTPPQIVHHLKVPRKRHSRGEKVTLRNGGRGDPGAPTLGYIWAGMPGVLFSDSHINEWGVGGTSYNCPSPEDKAELCEGGIGYMLRRLVAERAKTARQGVLLAGELVERFGYIDSGRTYIICDPEEGWLFCVVNGKHWLAQRVGDEKVAMVANTYTVRQVDLSDTNNFLASDDIIEYAVKRGWYDSKEDGPFDFAAVYANRGAASNPSNSGRQWAGLQYVAKKSIEPGVDLPFSVAPRGKVGVREIMEILRHDNEGKKAQSSSSKIIVCDTACPICSGATQTSFVAQLRGDKPLDIGIVYWMCLASPRTSFYIPFHFGISDFPAGFAAGSAQRPSEELYNGVVNSPFRADAMRAFWTFSNFHNKVEAAGAGAIERTKSGARQIEENAFSMQNSLEQAARKLYTRNKTAASQMLTNYSRGVYLSALEEADQVLSRK